MNTGLGVAVLFTLLLAAEPMIHAGEPDLSRCDVWLAPWNETEYTRCVGEEVTAPDKLRTPAARITGAGCMSDAVFVLDVTIPDDTVMKPGEIFRKTWRIRNSGSCSWDTGYGLYDLGSGEVVVPASSVIEPGDDVDVSIDMQAPWKNGTYTYWYQMQDAQGQLFGDKLYTRIIVANSTKPITSTPAWQGYTCDRCIKGNISYDSGERIYHFPGCEYYEETVINPAYGERWFSSEAEAVAAGWRKAWNCP